MRSFLSALGAGALLVCAGCASTDEVKPPPPWAVGKEVREGRVFSISEERLAVFDPRRPDRDGVILRLSPETVFVAAGRELERGEVVEGAPVRVYFDEEAPADEAPLATRVEVIDGRKR